MEANESKNLKPLLSKNHEKATEAQLIKLISDVYGIIGEEEFKKIINLDLTEVKTMKKIDLVSTMSTLKSKLITIAGDLTEIQNRDITAQDTNAANADFASELGSIDFANLIGGPLNACVTAQSNASMATVSFIQDVAFNKDKELRMVDFSHKKITKNPNFEKDPADVPDGTNVADETLEEEITIEVPFVSLLNVPSLRIENCEIDFNVKLNSVYTRDVSSEFELDTSLGIDYRWVKFDVSTSFKRSASTGVKVEKEYTMGVKVVATGDQLPGGLENVLGILAG